MFISYLAKNNYPVNRMVIGLQGMHYKLSLAIIKEKPA